MTRKIGTFHRLFRDAGTAHSLKAFVAARLGDSARDVSLTEMADAVRVDLNGELPPGYRLVGDDLYVDDEADPEPLLSPDDPDWNLGQRYLVDRDLDHR